MPWQTDRTGVSDSFSTEYGVTITFRAERIRKTNSGVAARLAIQQDGANLASDTFNIERDKDRTHLANKAYGLLPEDEQQGIGKRVFAAKVDRFCAEVWAQWAGRYEVEELGGDPEIGPPQYILKPYILAEGGTIIFGAPGSSKSTLLLLMAQSINAGIQEYWPCEKRPVLCINLERSAISIKRRMVHVNQALNLPLETTLPVMNARGRRFEDVLEAVAGWVEKHKEPVVMLDSITRGGFGDLKENEPANAIMDALNALCPTWIATGHPPRNGDHIYGSQMFDAAVDLAFQVTAQTKGDDLLGVGVKCTKANDVWPAPLTIYALRFDGYGLSEFRRAHNGEFLELEAQRKVGIEDQIHDYLLRAGWSNATEIASELDANRSTVSRALNAAHNLNSKRDGKRVLYSVKTG